MRKTSLRILALTLVLCLFVSVAVGCGGSQPPATQPPAAQPPANQGGQTPAEQPPAPARDPIVLRVAHHDPPTSNFSKAWEEFAALVEERSNGACKLELYPGEQLGKGADMVSMVTNNITDIGWVVAAFFPGQFPVSEVINLPMMGVPSSSVGAKSLWDLYQVNTKMQEEWAQGMHLISFTASGYQFLNTKDKQVVVPDDVKGLKIRVAGSNPSRFLEVLGASPIGMPPPDMYEALDKGVIDGYSLDWMGMNGFKLQDVTKYSMDMPFVSVPHGIVMNKAKWDSLPDDIKQVFNELGGEFATQHFGTAFDSADTPISQDFVKLDGREITKVTDEQKALWLEAAQPVWSDWVKTMDEKGHNGQEIIDTYRGFIEANAKAIPKK